MKVAITLTDQSFTRTKSMGIFNVSMGLTRGLMHCPEVTELHVLGNNECMGAFPDAPPHVHFHLTDKPVPRRFGRVWWDQFGLSAAIRNIAPDWAILPKGFPPFFSCMGKTKMACYVHDVGWEYYENQPAAIRNQAFPPHELLYFKNLSLHAMRTADLVLTHTRYNAGRIRAYVPQARVSCIGIGFTPPTTTPLPAEERRDILTYAGAFPHKRTELNIRRLSAWLAQRPDAEQIRIHVVGNLPEGLTLPDARWIHHNRLPFAELMRLLQTKCRMATYFSDYESFGMPPVECMLHGVPCVTSDLPGPRENVPEQYLFPNEDEAAFLQKANNTYDGLSPFTCPEFPTWAEVSQRCVEAMLRH